MSITVPGYRLTLTLLLIASYRLIEIHKLVKGLRRMSYTDPDRDDQITRLQAENTRLRTDLNELHGRWRRARQIAVRKGDAEIEIALDGNDIDDH
jgi:hypothetical protein